MKILKARPLSIFLRSPKVYICGYFLFILMSLACGDDETKLDSELHIDIRKSFGLSASGEVSPDELSMVINKTVRVGDSLDLVKEKISNFDLENKSWCSCSWDRYLDTWTCEIVTGYKRGWLGEQRGVALLFFFDESKHLLRYEVMPYHLRDP